jgi:hypothetical protein
MLTARQRATAPHRAMSRPAERNRACATARCARGAINSTQMALGLTMGLARSTIDLNGPLLLPWMEALVAAGCITQDRVTQTMTP